MAILWTLYSLSTSFFFFFGLWGPELDLQVQPDKCQIELSLSLPTINAPRDTTQDLICPYCHSGALQVQLAHQHSQVSFIHKDPNLHWAAPLMSSQVQDLGLVLVKFHTVLAKQKI